MIFDLSINFFNSMYDLLYINFKNVKIVKMIFRIRKNTGIFISNVLSSHYDNKLSIFHYDPQLPFTNEAKLSHQPPVQLGVWKKPYKG